MREEATLLPRRSSHIKFLEFSKSTISLLWQTVQKKAGSELWNSTVCITAFDVLGAIASLQWDDKDSSHNFLAGFVVGLCKRTLSLLGELQSGEEAFVGKGKDREKEKEMGFAARFGRRNNQDKVIILFPGERSTFESNHCFWRDRRRVKKSSFQQHPVLLLLRLTASGNG